MYARVAHMSGIAVSLALLVALSVVPTSRADTALTYFLCIDPGHGGSDPGAKVQTDLDPDYWEADLNLQIAIALVDSLIPYSFCLTRDSDVSMDLKHRATFADSVEAEWFISIHHNSSTNPTAQYTVAMYCSLSVVQPGVPKAGEPRNPDSKLADKIGLRIRDKIGAWPIMSDHPMAGNYAVLKWSTMHSAISEACFISCPSTADSMWNNTGNIREQEAGAIFRAWLSAWTGQGFGLVDYEYCGKGPFDYLEVEVTVGILGEPHIQDIPYRGCWALDDLINLFAIDFTLSEYDYTFHHWEWRDFSADTTIAVYYTNPNGFVFPSWDDSVHYWLAYFTGGPFWVTLIDPDPENTEIQNNSLCTIRWLAPAGARQTCSLYIDLSTNGGSGWSPIAGPIPYNNNPRSRATGSYDWSVPGISSDNCYLRFIAYDVADNHDTLISHRFGIDCYEPCAALWIDTDSGDVPLTVHFYDESTHDPTSWVWHFGDGDISYDQNPTHIYDSIGIYTVSLTATNHCGSDDTVMVDLIEAGCSIEADFTAEPTSGTAPLNVHFMDNSNPQFYGDYYLWDFGDGTTSEQLYTANHTYSNPGLYTVSLTVHLPCGAVDSTTKENLIDAKCLDGTYGEEWTKLFDQNFPIITAVQPFYDGGYLLGAKSFAGGDCKVHLWRINSCGDIIWDRPCAARGSIRGLTGSGLSASSSYPANKSVIIDKTFDDGFVIKEGAVVLKLDRNGDLEWTSSPSLSTYSYCVHQTNDSGYLAAGRVYTGSSDILLTWLDSLGSVLRLDTISSPLDLVELWLDARPTSDGGCIVVSDCYTTDPYDANIYVGKLSTSGTVEWDTIVGGPGKDEPCTVIEVSDGYIVSATSNWDFRLLKFDYSGNVVWDRTYDEGSSEVLYDMVPAADGGFILAGTNDWSGPASDFYIVKTGQYGQQLWSKTIDAGAKELLYSCIETAQGGLILGGQTVDADILALVVKTTVPEEYSCCVIRGDINHSGAGPDISDLVYLQTYMFQFGPEPPCMEEADIDGDGTGPDISDLVYLVTYMFQFGPAPVPCP